MSVPEGQRSKGKLEVLIKANELAVYTIQICTNQKVFKPEYRSAMTDDIIRAAKNIFIYCWTANNIRAGKDPDKARQRKRLQEQAILECYSLLAMMQMAKKLFHLSSKRIKYWGSMTIEVRDLIRGWKEADSKRYPLK